MMLRGSQFGHVILLSVWLWALLSGAAAAGASIAPRAFAFPADTLAFANELSCDYELDPASGRMVEHPRVPQPAYTLHCFVVVRMARQFLDHARFEPNEPKATHAAYRHLIRMVLSKSPRVPSRVRDKIVFPGYSTLREFSRDYAELLKEESGGAWQSFVQRGNWRMIFPFSRRQQWTVAQRLVKSLEKGRPPVVHLVCFPALTLNHAVLVFDSHATADGIEFDAYDPNDPARPVKLSYRRGQGGFYFPRSIYFAGGAVDVYEVYRGWFY